MITKSTSTYIILFVSFISNSYAQHDIGLNLNYVFNDEKLLRYGINYQYNFSSRFAIEGIIDISNYHKNYTCNDCPKAWNGIVTQFPDDNIGWPYNAKYKNTFLYGYIICKNILTKSKTAKLRALISYGITSSFRLYEKYESSYYTYNNFTHSIDTGPYFSSYQKGFSKASFEQFALRFSLGANYTITKKIVVELQPGFDFFPYSFELKKWGSFYGLSYIELKVYYRFLLQP